MSISIVAVSRPRVRFAIRLLTAYAVGTPLILVPLWDRGYLGASDILAVFGILALLSPGVSGGPLLRIFFAFAGTSLLVGILGTLFDPQRNLLDLSLLLRMLACHLPLFIALHAPRLREWDIRRILLWAWIASLISLSAAIVLFHQGVQTREEQQRLWSADGSSVLRGGGLLGNSSDLGLLAATVGASALAYMLYQRIAPMLALLMVAICLYATFISSSRAAWLHLLVSFTFLVPIILRQWVRWLPRVGVFLAVTVAGVSLAGLGGQRLFRWELSEQFADRFRIAADSGGGLFSSSTRLSTWDAMLNLVADNFLLGIGYDSTMDRVGQAGDNSFLSIFVELGVVAGILYLSLWTYMLFLVFRDPSWKARLTGLSLLAGHIVHMLTLDAHRMWSSMPLATLLIGLWFRLRNEESAIYHPTAPLGQVTLGRGSNWKPATQPTNYALGSGSSSSAPAPKPKRSASRTSMSSSTAGDCHPPPRQHPDQRL